jgi:hypothetical protein
MDILACISLRPNQHSLRMSFSQNFFPTNQEQTMKPISKSKSAHALVLAIALASAGCSTQWINIALQDLPVLTQMALNLANLVSVLASGKQASAAETAVIQNISVQASRDLNLLQSLCADYKSSRSSATLQKIQEVTADLNRNVPALLQSAHIANPVLSARVAAAVNLILSTVNSLASLMPQNAPATSRIAEQAQLPSASELKRQWNQQVCAPTGNFALDAAFEQSIIR